MAGDGFIEALGPRRGLRGDAACDRLAREAQSLLLCSAEALLRSRPGLYWGLRHDRMGLSFRSGAFVPSPFSARPDGATYHLGVSLLAHDDWPVPVERASGALRENWDLLGRGLVSSPLVQGSLSRVGEPQALLRVVGLPLLVSLSSTREGSPQAALR